MNTVVLAVRTRFQAPDCRFEVQVQPDLPLVRADSQALSTALLNLLDNAYKYSGESKEILLQATASNGDVIFSVKDNGLGISPREAKRIFRPFYQVDQRLSRSSGGFGLGLSIVQQIVAAHNGRTFVESQPGQGSSFIIKLPAVDRSARPVHLSSTEAVVAVYDRQSAEASRDPEKRGNHSNPPCIRPPH